MKLLNSRLEKQSWKCYSRLTLQWMSISSLSRGTRNICIHVLKTLYCWYRLTENLPLQKNNKNTFWTFLVMLYKIQRKEMYWILKYCSIVSNQETKKTKKKSSSHWSKTWWARSIKNNTTNFPACITSFICSWDSLK